MTSLSDQARVEARKRDPSTALLRGVIRDTATGVEDRVHVTITSQSRGRRQGPCPWMPRGDVFPSAGDACRVAFDEDGQPVIVEWWSATPPSSGSGGGGVLGVDGGSPTSTFVADLDGGTP